MSERLLQWLNGAKKFGATAHVMTEKIDEGEIVATNSFSVPKNTDRLALASLAYNAALELFATVASFVIENDGKMPRSGEKWQGQHKPSGRLLLHY